MPILLYCSLSDKSAMHCLAFCFLNEVYWITYQVVSSNALIHLITSNPITGYTLCTHYSACFEHFNYTRSIRYLANRCHIISYKNNLWITVLVESLKNNYLFSERINCMTLCAYMRKQFLVQAASPHWNEFFKMPVPYSRPTHFSNRHHVHIFLGRKTIVGITFSSWFNNLNS